MRIKVNISLDPETVSKLKELAAASHRNVSQWVTEKVWEEARKQKTDSEQGSEGKA